jgi:hypothetical protein
MKHLFGPIAFSILLLGSAFQAQAQDSSVAASEEEEEAYEFFYAEVAATAIQNENCKSVLEPTYYEGFRVLLRVYFGEMGATNDQILEEEANAVKHAEYICMDKAACWRSATGLPATATPEDGRLACMTGLTESFKSLDEFLAPEAGA